LAKRARTSRDAAHKAISTAEQLTDEAKQAESLALAAQNRHWKRSGGSSSGGHRKGWADDLPVPPAAPAAPAPPDTLLHRLNEVGEKLDGVEVLSSDASPREDRDRDSQWMSRDRSEQLSIISRTVMGLLRYGNLGGKRHKITPTPLGWRSAAEIAELLGYDQADIVEATKTSIDKTGYYRYEFEGPTVFPQNSENPNIRPLYSKSRRDRK
jgi:hypothetical protein